MYNFQLYLQIKKLFCLRKAIAGQAWGPVMAHLPNNLQNILFKIYIWISISFHWIFGLFILFEMEMTEGQAVAWRIWFFSLSWALEDMFFFLFMVILKWTAVYWFCRGNIWLKVFYLILFYFLCFIFSLLLLDLFFRFN